MKLNYPQSIPCSFDNFPVALDIRMGPSAGDIVPGASLGSKVILTRTPKSGAPQGDYVVGSPLPDRRMIYSDTGSDDDFAIKISFSGFGTFYKLTSSDEFLRFRVYKAIAIETPSAGEKVFGDIFDCETLIPATGNVTSLFSYDGPIAEYVDPADSETDDGGAYFYINEGGYQQKFYLSNGAVFRFTSDTGITTTYSVVSGVLVIS